MIVMLVLCLFTGSMRAEKNLTVYEGTDTQGMIPVAGGMFNYYNKSQYVIPAAQLTDMVGSNIYALAYHLRVASTCISRRLATPLSAVLNRLAIRICTTKAN